MGANDPELNAGGSSPFFPCRIQSARLSSAAGFVTSPPPAHSMKRRWRRASLARYGWRRPFIGTSKGHEEHHSTLGSGHVAANARGLISWGGGIVRWCDSCCLAGQSRRRAYRSKAARRSQIRTLRRRSGWLGRVQKPSTHRDDPRALVHLKAPRKGRPVPK